MQSLRLTTGPTGCLHALLTGSLSLCLHCEIRTHGGTGARVEAVVTEPLKEGGLSHTRVPHQDDLEEAVRRREATSFLLGRERHDGNREWKEATGTRSQNREHQVLIT